MNASSRLDAGPGCQPLHAPEWETRRLWSLWDMINFQLSGICALLRQLHVEEQEMAGRVGVHELVGGTNPLALPGSLAPNALPSVRMPLYITDEDRRRMEEWLKFGAP